jgi:hypothetical protein
VSAEREREIERESDSDDGEERDQAMMRELLESIVEKERKG